MSGESSWLSPWFIGVAGVSLLGFALICLHTVKEKRTLRPLPILFLLLCATLFLGGFMAQITTQREIAKVLEMNRNWLPLIAKDIRSNHEEIPVSVADQQSKGEKIRRQYQKVVAPWLDLNRDLAAAFTFRKAPNGDLIYQLGTRRQANGDLSRIKPGSKMQGEIAPVLEALGNPKIAVPRYGKDGMLDRYLLVYPLSGADGKVYGGLGIEILSHDWMAPAKSARKVIFVMTLAMAISILGAGMLVIQLHDTLTNFRVSKAELLLKSEQAQEQMDIIARNSQDIASQQAELMEANRKLKTLATMDGLTGVLNHRSLMEALSKAMKEKSVMGSPCSVVLLDIDNFKQLNDQYGHIAGDDALRVISSVLRQSCPAGAYVGRYGGEEFMMVLPGASESAAMAVAEELRHRIQVAPMTSRTCTASFGVSTVYSMAKSEQTLIDEADRSLYHSKRNGKNRVTHYGHGLLDTA